MTIRPNDDLAAFATHLTAEDTPAEARRRAVDAITDCVGCSLAGSGSCSVEDDAGVTHEPVAAS